MNTKLPQNALGHLELEHLAVEGLGTIEVGDLQVDMADGHGSA